MHRQMPLWAAFLFLVSSCSYASIFGVVRGIVHDPHHRPVANAEITVSSMTSDYSAKAVSNELGEFSLTQLPLGRYSVTVNAPGFVAPPQEVVVVSTASAEVHFQLEVASVQQKVEVTAQAPRVDTQSSQPPILLDREQIAATPGAQRANSQAMIVDYVPSAYIVHDMLHVRGGHQVSWLIDGIPVPNTNIASGVAPAFDPKDIDTIQMQRGGYSADYGDRIYSVFNVLTRSGFERNNQGELVLDYGSYNSTDDQISFGSHTDRFAYYSSISGNRSEYGLETPIPEILHDERAGLSGFTSLIFNPNSKDQVRMVMAVRGDHYQVPNDFDQQAAGIRDTENEGDAFVNFSWVHAADRDITYTLSPFYHFNRTNYRGGPDDPLITEQKLSSNYAGGTALMAVHKLRNTFRAGLEGYAQLDDQFFGLTDTVNNQFLRQGVSPTGNFEALYMEDQWRPLSWLTFNGGVRFSHFSSSFTETSADPRAGLAIQLPAIHWVLRGFYGRYYQPPPLSTVSGPLEQFAIGQGFGFLPLQGERDEQVEAGLTIPLLDWALDADAYQTKARNFFDHDVLGNSNIFFPLTIQNALIQGWETTLRSPQIMHRASMHLAFAHQFARGKGAVTGGLTDFSPPGSGYFFLDHDQRDTLSVGYQVALPWRLSTSGNFNYGSGFLFEDGPDHLPSHATFDFSFSRPFGERWNATLTALNITNNRYLLDTSNTFGGTHYDDPRQIFVQLRYRFHY